MKPHNWAPAERGVHVDKPGLWHECSGCHKRVFFPDSYSKFQRDLSVAVAWIEDVEGLDHLEREYVPASDIGKIGLHGILSQDCEKAQLFAADYVMGQ